MQFHELALVQLAARPRSCRPRLTHVSIDKTVSGASSSMTHPTRQARISRRISHSKERWCCGLSISICLQNVECINWRICGCKSTRRQICLTMLDQGNDHLPSSAIVTVTILTLALPRLRFPAPKSAHHGTAIKHIVSTLQWLT